MNKSNMGSDSDSPVKPDLLKNKPQPACSFLKCPFPDRLCDLADGNKMYNVHFLYYVADLMSPLPALVQPHVR